MDPTNRRRFYRSLHPREWRETVLMIRLRARRVLRRVSFILRSLRTPPGRERVRLGVCAKFPRPLRRLALLHRATLIKGTRIVAIVGSFGKTTTTRAVSAALGTPSPGSAGWNSGIAVTTGVLGIRPVARHGVLEVGIAAKGQMEGYAQLIRPNIVVVTSIGSEHHNSLGTLEETRTEKSKMVQALPPTGLAVLNGDDPHVLWMKENTKARVVTYGVGEANDVRASNVMADDLTGLRFTVHVDGQPHDVQTRLIGQHMVHPILAGIAVAHTQGRDLAQVFDALGRLKPTWNRLTPIEHPSGAWLLLDAYKGAQETIESALDAMEAITADRKIVVLGDVEEPRGSQGPVYRGIGQRVAEVADRVLFVGGKTNFNRLKVGTSAGGMPREAMENVHVNPLTAASLLAPDLGAGDLVLIKGRCTQHLERVALALTGREVGCVTRTCHRKHSCASCILLRTGE